MLPIAAFALSEPEAGSDVAALKTRAVLEGDGYSLEVAHLLSVIRGEVELRATLDDALILTRLLERERESLRDRRTVET